MAILYPRYKRYAPWPVVLWCRLRGHPIQAWWHSGEVQRCINCGDTRFIATRDKSAHHTKGE
jgi:hypothetical protein